jgi:hypothetical protein
MDTKKEARVAILIYDKRDFKSKLVRRDKEGHFISIKGIIYQEELTNVNINTPNIGTFNFIKHY